MWIRLLSFFVLAASLLCSACGKKEQAQTEAKLPVHEHHAPHGGTLVEIGEGEFAHLELLLDPSAGMLTAYSLDGEAENPIRLKQSKIDLVLRINDSPQELKMALNAHPNSLTGETVGDTSEFSNHSDRLKHAATLKGTILSITTKGQKFEKVPLSYPAEPEKS